MQFAAIGTDGARLVVWGMGATVADAREEASNYEGEIVRVVEVTDERAAAIEAGDVGADDLVGLPEVFAPAGEIDAARLMVFVDGNMTKALAPDPADEHADAAGEEAAAEWDAAGGEA